MSSINCNLFGLRSNGLFMYSCLLTILSILWTQSIHAELDTLRNHDARSGYIYYRDPNILMQAARFNLAIPGYIREIRLYLGGTAHTGSAIVHVYGYEGGMNAPLLERDLIPPIQITKKHPGVDTVTIILSDNLFINNSQFFIAVDHLSPGIALLSDRRKKHPACSTVSDYFGYQYLKLADNQWGYGDYSFAVDIVMEYPKVLTDPHLTDITAKAGIRDSIASASSIAWGDYNGDSYLDVLVDGQLYQNNGGNNFTNITRNVGLFGKPRAQVFIDMNNDGNLDILSVGDIDEQPSSSRVFINNGEGLVVPHVLNVPPILNPSSLAIADADNDGYLDLFIGQWSVPGDSFSNYLLLNNHNGGFSDKSVMLYGGQPQFNGCAGAQWIDVDGDRRPELFVRTSSGDDDELWWYAGDGAFDNQIAQFGHEDLQRRRGVGCHWLDYNNDGVIDGFLPESVPIDIAKKEGTGSGVVITGRRVVDNQGFEMPTLDRMAQFQSRQAGATWGDVDNDGLVDLFITSSCPCHYAALYLQQPNHTFMLHSYEYGLTTVAAGADGIWVDFDNDGKLDLATFINGRFKLLKNSVPSSSNFVEIDLQGVEAIGAEVKLHSGGSMQARQVSSGRGVLMQEPLRLHFGVGDVNKVDSVEVFWRSGATEVFRNIDVNRVSKLEPGTGDSPVVTALNVIASPNPFSATITFRYSLTSAGFVDLNIYSLDGRLVRRLVQGTQSSGEHSLLWNGVDDQGESVAGGTYLYRLLTAIGEARGTIVVTR